MRRKHKIRLDDIGVGISVVITVIAAIFAIVLLFARVIWRPIDKVSNIREVQGTVTRLAVKNEARNKGTYLVFTENTKNEIMVLEVSDSVWRWRFDSSDVWGEIEEGKTYVFTVGGSRSEFWSWYPNIYEFKKVENTN